MIVKDNQLTLKTDIAHLFALAANPGDDLRSIQRTNKGHGRIETRTLWASTDLNDYLDWPGVGQVLRLKREFYYPKDDKSFVEWEYGITSLTPDQIDLDTLLLRWRQHWSIENKLHWVRDVIMGEDTSLLRTGDLPQAMAAMRNAVISLIKMLGYSSVKAARRHFALDLPRAITSIYDPLE